MDTLSSVIAAIVNAQRQNYREIRVTTVQGAGSSIVRHLFQRLQREGYIQSASFVAKSYKKAKPVLVYTIALKYDSNGNPAIRSFFRVSTPSRRVYIKTTSF